MPHSHVRRGNSSTGIPRDIDSIISMVRLRPTPGRAIEPPTGIRGQPEQDIVGSEDFPLNNSALPGATGASAVGIVHDDLPRTGAGPPSPTRSWSNTGPPAPQIMAHGRYRRPAPAQKYCAFCSSARSRRRGGVARVLQRNPPNARIRRCAWWLQEVLPPSLTPRSCPGPSSCNVSWRSDGWRFNSGRLA